MKNKRLFSFLVVMVMIISMFLSTSGVAISASMKGAGTAASPYKIYYVNDLYQIPNNPNASYKLMNNLDLENIEMTPMAEFNGILDGNGYTIKNLKITGTSDMNQIGLFSTLNDSTIKNLNFENTDITGSANSIGTLAGTMSNTTLINCSIKNINITTSSSITGGLCGVALNSTVSNCSVEDVLIRSSSSVGGLFGSFSNGEIRNSYSHNGEVISDNDNTSNPFGIGGLIGNLTNTTVTRCYATTNVTANENYAGGLIGSCQGAVSISMAFAANSINGGIYMGGIIGSNNADSSIISDCYSECIIDREENTELVGGIIGYNNSPSNRIQLLMNSYSASKILNVTIISRLLYGITSNIILENSYYDYNKSPIKGTSQEVRFTTNMYQKSNYKGWNFYNIWTIDEGKDYPRLRFQSEINKPDEPHPSRTLKLVLMPNEQLRLAVDENITENTKMTWTSSDSEIVTVDSKGLVKALKKGNAIITVKSADNSYTEEIKVIVVDNVNEYRLTIDLKVGEKCRLTIDEAEDLIGSWTSLDTAVATVTNKGRVTAVEAGLTIITGYDEDGQEVGQVYVRVR